MVCQVLLNYFTRSLRDDRRGPIGSVLLSSGLIVESDIVIANSRILIRFEFPDYSLNIANSFELLQGPLTSVDFLILHHFCDVVKVKGKADFISICESLFELN